MKIVLGSASPRRSELLRGLGFHFTLLKADCSEEFDPTHTPEKIVQSIAQQKIDALEIQLTADVLLICADTIVVLDQEIIGKPEDSEEAKRLLRRLSGRTHNVFTGVIMKTTLKQKSFTAKTTVYFRTLTEVEIAHYVENFNPLDKAGSYGIQDWIGLIAVEKIDGSYTNVMGLPTVEVYAAIQEFLA